MFLRGYVEKILYIKGSDVTGENVNLIAKGNVNVEAAANTSVFESKDTKSGSQIGVSFSVNGMSAYGYAYGSKEKGDGTTVTWTGSNVKASDTLNIETGKDTNITGSKVSGDKVNMNVGGDLNIQSLQDIDNQKYDSSNYGISGSIGFSGSIDGKGGLNVSGSKNKINSEYSSVTDQAGIYAGNRGFDINVGNNTDLKGAVIDSTVTSDKNTLTTGTITFDDIKNKAEYDSSGNTGFSYLNDDLKNTTVAKGLQGLTPLIGMKTGDEDESTTKSAIADGTIVLTKPSEQKQDVTQLNRNTQDTLNKLDKIFDKKEIEEKQELAGLFAELSFNAIHDLSATKKDKDGNVIKQGWSEEQKVLAHAAVGYISAELAGSKSSFSTALAAGVNKFVTEEILKDDKALAHYKEHPEELQWLSAALGATIGQMAGDAGSGASIAASATKNNLFLDKVIDVNEIDTSRAELGEAVVYGISVDVTKVVSGVLSAVLQRPITIPGDITFTEVVGKFNDSTGTAFDSWSLTFGKSAIKYPVEAFVGKGYIEDANHKTVYNSDIIRETVRDYSNTTSVRGLFGVDTSINLQDYKFIINVAGTNISFGIGPSWTKIINQPKDVKK